MSLRNVDTCNKLTRPYLCYGLFLYVFLSFFLIEAHLLKGRSTPHDVSQRAVIIIERLGSHSRWGLNVDVTFSSLFSMVGLLYKSWGVFNNW